MERVQQPDGATSGVRVLPLSKGIGEGTVQLHPYPHIGSGPLRSLSSVAPRLGFSLGSLWLPKTSESEHWKDKLSLV